MKDWNALVKNEKGQGMTEYIIIVILIALFVLLATRFLGQKVSNRTNAAADKVGGLEVP